VAELDGGKFVRKEVLELVVPSATSGIPASALILSESWGNRSVHLGKLFGSLFIPAKPADSSVTASLSSAFVPVLITLHSLTLNYMSYLLELRDYNCLALHCLCLLRWYFQFAGALCRALCPRFGAGFAILLPVETG